MSKISFAKAIEEMPKNYASDITINRDVSHTVKVHKMHKFTSQPFTFLKPSHISLPHLAEQHRIVAKVNQLIIPCDCVETSLTQAYTTRLDLFNALHHGALDPMAQSLESVK